MKNSRTDDAKSNTLAAYLLLQYLNDSLVFGNLTAPNYWLYFFILDP